MPIGRNAVELTDSDLIILYQIIFIFEVISLSFMCLKSVYILQDMN